RPETAQAVAARDVCSGKARVVTGGLARETAGLAHGSDLQPPFEVGDDRHMSQGKDARIFLVESGPALVGQARPVRLDLLCRDPHFLARLARLPHAQAALRFHQSLFLREEVRLPLRHPPRPVRLDVCLDLALELAAGMKEVLLQSASHPDVIAIQPPTEELREHLVGDLSPEAASDLMEVLPDQGGVAHGLNGTLRNGVRARSPCPHVPAGLRGRWLVSPQLEAPLASWGKDVAPPSRSLGGRGSFRPRLPSTPIRCFFNV